MSKFILIVDDDPLVVEICKHKLIQDGYTVLTATNGEEAFKALGAQKVDLIILDVQMPEMDGYTFILEKAKIPDYADIPVLVLTTLGEVEPIFKRHGVKGYLLKPLNIQELFNKVLQIAGPAH